MTVYHLPEATRTAAAALFARGLSVTAVARTLACKPTQLRTLRRRMIEAGELQAARRRSAHRPWSQRDDTMLGELIDQGHSYDEIARRLTRTRTAVLQRAKRRRERYRTNASSYTTHRIAALLGIPCAKIVAAWITRHGLPARKPARNVWSVAWIDLMTWLEEPSHWMTYDPARITELALREHLTEIRYHQPRWLRIGTVAQRYHVTHPTVSQWVRNGLLPAVKYGNYWIRESDLVGFTSPYDRPRRSARCNTTTAPSD